MQSYIKKSALIKDFRMQVNGKSKKIVEALDEPFFSTLNRVFKKKPQDVKLHITKDNTMVFNIDFTTDVNLYLEYFPKSEPSTIFTLSHGEEIPLSDTDDLESCLDIIDESISTKN